MAQRISRAKTKVSGVSLDQPGDLVAVMHVLYLMFNEGYSGDVDLAAEAISLALRLTRVVDDPEVAGLQALAVGAFVVGGTVFSVAVTADTGNGTLATGLVMTAVFGLAISRRLRPET